MKAGTVVAPLMALILTFGTAPVRAGGIIEDQKPAPGAITRIFGNNVSVRARDGREVTGEVSSTQGLKVGDEVVFRAVDRPGRTRSLIVESGKTQKPAAVGSSHAAIEQRQRAADNFEKFNDREAATRLKAEVKVRE